MWRRRQRWLEQLARRYNEYGPEALGDRRRGNGAPARILTPELLEKLRARLVDRPPDGGVWTTPKIAVWMAHELGIVSVFAQRAWDALRAIGWTIQTPRPKNPKSATPEEAAAFKKSSRIWSPKSRRNIPTRRSRSSRPMSTGSA
ncbi:MAG: helix-turn-helix domain-containing protein [Roseiarcus sp.]